MIGVVTTLEGEPLPAGDIASRLGGFADVETLETVAGGASTTDARLIETILGNQNEKHSAYQDFQKFLQLGGKIGLQHDPLLYGAYNLNPFLVRVEEVPMLVVEQGQVAVINAYVGSPDAGHVGYELSSAASFVRPSRHLAGRLPHREVPDRSALLPASSCRRSSSPELGRRRSQAHNLDAQLKQIEAKSSEGFPFAIDLQVQIHIPDTQAPYVISMVGSVANLVNEVLQAAVGNHFRNKLQSMPAVSFIASREAVQKGAFEYRIKEELAKYRVETRGVYIQAVVLPSQLVAVLTQREIANQQVATYRIAEVRPGPADRDREGQRHRRHAGGPRESQVGVAFKPTGPRRERWKRRARPRTDRADRRGSGRPGKVGRSGSRRSL